MSILQRVLQAPLSKINTERLPSGATPSVYSGYGQQASGHQSQLGTLASVSWLYAVVTRIAQAVADAEWKLYEVRGDEQEEAPDHPAMQLWLSQNEFITRQDFLETSQEHMELVGEMWWVLLRNFAGVPVEMQVVRPDRMFPIPHPTEFISGYRYRIGSETITLDKNDVIFSRQPNPEDPYRGISVVRSLLVDLGAERMAAEWMLNFFRNSAEPGGIIEFPNGLQDAEFNRLVDRWRYQHQGVANAHRVAILERGTWKDRKLTQRDMQYKELREFERDQILGAFGMPLPIMGITESVNRANAEAANVMFQRWLVRPRLMRIRAALNQKFLKLFPDAENLRFDFIDPVPENREALIAEATLGYEKGILTLNESRRRFGEDDWEGEEGDQLQPTMESPMDFAFDETAAGYKPRRRPMKVADNDEYPDEANEEADTIEDSWKSRFEAELNSIIDHLAGNTKSLSTQKFTLAEVDQYDWNWWSKYGDAVVIELARAFAQVIVAEVPNMPPPQVQRLASLYAEQRGAQLLRLDGDLNLAKMTRKRVNALVSRSVTNGDSIQTLAANMRKDLSFSADRARMVARTETAAALGQGQKEAARSQGRSEKRWVTQGDSRVNEPICRTNSGQGWIKMNDRFQSKHDTIPGHVNCRCVVQYRNTPIDDSEERSFISEVRCPLCNRKHGDNVAIGTSVKCRRCKHEYEV